MQFFGFYGFAKSDLYEMAFRRIEINLRTLSSKDHLAKDVLYLVYKIMSPFFSKLEDSSKHSLGKSFEKKISFVLTLF